MSGCGTWYLSVWRTKCTYFALLYDKTLTFVLSVLLLGSILHQCKLFLLFGSISDATIKLFWFETMKQVAGCSCGGASAASYQADIGSFRWRQGEPYLFQLNDSHIEDLTYVLEGADDLPPFYSVDEQKAREYLDSLDTVEAMCRAITVTNSSLFDCRSNPVTPGININRMRGEPEFDENTRRLMWPEMDKDDLFFDLPGHGKKGRCGIVRDSEGRPEVNGCVHDDACHFGLLHRWFCERPQCTDWHCLLHYCRSKAEEEADKLVAGDYLFNDTRGRIQHIVLSWDPDSDLSWMSSREEFNRKLREAYALLMEAGVVAGICIFHAERWEGEEKQSPEDVKRFPADALKNGLKMHLGPHLHVVGPAWLKPEKVAEIFERTCSSEGRKDGIVIRSIADRNADGERIGREDAEKIIAYCLSHAGLGFPLSGEGKAVRVVRQFGAFSSRREDGLKKVATLTESEAVECPVCKAMNPDSGPSYLYDVRSYMRCRIIGEVPEPVTTSREYGVYCAGDFLSRVRDSIKGLTPSEIVEFARKPKNRAFVYTGCVFPDLTEDERERVRLSVVQSDWVLKAVEELRRHGFEEAGGDA